jgi:hypothetical protein
VMLATAVMLETAVMRATVVMLETAVTLAIPLARTIAMVKATLGPTLAKAAAATSAPMALDRSAPATASMNVTGVWRTAQVAS